MTETVITYLVYDQSLKNLIEHIRSHLSYSF